MKKKAPNIKSNKSPNFQTLKSNKKKKKPKNLKEYYFLQNPIKLYNKYIIILQNRALISLMVIITALNSYEYDSNTIMLRLNLYMTFYLSILSVIYYLISLYQYGKYLRIIKMINKDTNIFYYTGLHRILIYSLFLLSNFNLWNGEIFDTEFSGIFTKENKNVLYSRKVFDYLIIIKFVTHFYNIIFCYIKIFAKPRNNRSINILKTKSIFIIKIFLFDFFNISVIILFFSSIFFFAVIIRISENSYYRYLKKSSFENYEDYQNFLSHHKDFDNYKNCIWYIFITITTIGYGELSVQTLLSRIVSFFLNISGMVIVAYVIIGLKQIFELNKSQKFTKRIYDAVEMREKMKIEVNKAFKSFIFKMVQKVRDKKNREDRKKKKLLRLFIKQTDLKNKLKEMSQFSHMTQISNEGSFFQMKDLFKTDTNLQKDNKKFFGGNYKTIHKSNSLLKEMEDENKKFGLKIKRTSSNNINDKLKHNLSFFKEMKTEVKPELIKESIFKEQSTKKTFKKRKTSEMSEKSKKYKKVFGFYLKKNDFLNNKEILAKLAEKKLNKNKKYKKFNINQLKISELKNLKKAHDILYIYNKKYNKRMMQTIKFIDNYKILKYQYTNKYGPENTDYLKYLIDLVDDIIDDFIIFFFIKNKKLFQTVEGLKKWEKILFKRSLYLMPFGKRVYDKRKR